MLHQLIHWLTQSVTRQDVNVQPNSKAAASRKHISSLVQHATAVHVPKQAKLQTSNSFERVPVLKHIFSDNIQNFKTSIIKQSNANDSYSLNTMFIFHAY